VARAARTPQTANISQPRSRRTFALALSPWEIAFAQHDHRRPNGGKRLLAWSTLLAITLLLALFFHAVAASALIAPGPHGPPAARESDSTSTAALAMATTCARGLSPASGPRGWTLGPNGRTRPAALQTVEERGLSLPFTPAGASQPWRQRIVLSSPEVGRLSSNIRCERISHRFAKRQVAASLQGLRKRHRAQGVFQRARGASMSCWVVGGRGAPMVSRTANAIPNRRAARR
jgi:hypothetical protein